MDSRLLRVFVSVALLLGITLASAHGQDAPIQTGKGHRFACTDYSGKKVFIVSPEGKVEWEYETGNCNDIWVLPNGNVLFNTGHGVEEVNPAKEVVFSYKSESEVYACQRLANGNTFIGECNSGRLIEVSPEGEIVKEVRLLPEGKDGGHTFMRNARKLESGNYLVSHYERGSVAEYNPDGKKVWEVAVPGGAHSAVRLPNGNTLIAEADKFKAASVLEVDPEKNIVWQVKHDELPGISLKFMTGLHRLPNGNTVMSNWVGHGHFGEAPHIIEVTPDKEVVWTFQDHETMKTVSSVQVLDVLGNPLKGEVIH